MLRQQSHENAVRHGSDCIDYARNDLAEVFTLAIKQRAVMGFKMYSVSTCSIQL